MSTRVLLVNPAFDYHSRHLLMGEPLSLGYLAGSLRHHGYEVGVLDAAANSITRCATGWRYGLQDHEAAAKIREFKPDIVGITCPFSLRIDSALNVAKMAKAIDARIVTVVGGIHPTIFPLETVQDEHVDYVIVGEGDESFLHLVRELESGRRVAQVNVDGCAYKGDGGGQLVPKQKFVEDLDALPFPARDLLPMEFYIRRETILYGLGKRRSASIITSRSCPMRCTFCSMFLSHGTKWRGRSARNVFDEIELLVKKYRIEELFFMDDNLTFDKERMAALCEMILAKGLRLRWNTPNGVAANRLDGELVTLMKRAGCVNICIGVESGNEVVRNRIIKKGLPEETIKRALSACNKAGLPVVGLFILGIPGETASAFKDTLAMVRDLPFGMIATSFFTPFPGTQLYEECLQKGYIDRDYWKQIDGFNKPVVETPDFDKAALRKWEKQIYAEFVRSHFWSLFASTITFRNEFFKLEQLSRFVSDKFLAST